MRLERLGGPRGGKSLTPEFATNISQGRNGIGLGMGEGGVICEGDRLWVEVLLTFVLTEPPHVCFSAGVAGQIARSETADSQR